MHSFVLGLSYNINYIIINNLSNYDDMLISWVCFLKFHEMLAWTAHNPKLDPLQTYSERERERAPRLLSYWSILLRVQHQIKSYLPFSYRNDNNNILHFEMVLNCKSISYTIRTHKRRNCCLNDSIMRIMWHVYSITMWYMQQ